MIVTSKRCYLNILTQLVDSTTLLNANYYIADMRDNSASMSLNDNLGYNDDGQLVVDHAVSNIPRAVSRYNITYGNCEIDPSPFISNTLIGLGDGSMDNPVERYIKHLNSISTLITVYDDLFKRQLRGNGLQIVIFNEDSIIDIYVDIACKWLAHNFGADITFIDPQYRPNIHGSVEYHGDKIFAQKNIADIRDAELLLNFNQMITSYGDNNLTTYLSSFDSFEKIIHLYNLLFPDAPLPPDNYTIDHIKQIIIGRIQPQLPKNPLSNVFTPSDFLAMVEQYDSEETTSDDDYYGGNYK